MGYVLFVTWIAIVMLCAHAKSDENPTMFYAWQDPAHTYIPTVQGDNMRTNEVSKRCGERVCNLVVFFISFFLDVCFACMHENVVNYRSNDD